MVGYIVYTNTRSRDICDMYYNSIVVTLLISSIIQAVQVRCKM